MGSSVTRTTSLVAISRIVHHEMTQTAKKVLVVKAKLQIRCLCRTEPTPAMASPGSSFFVVVWRAAQVQAQH